jgi:hypothetical protein
VFSVISESGIGRLVDQSDGGPNPAKVSPLLACDSSI